MSTSDLDRSEWVRREERAQQARAARLAHVQGKLDELGRILADHGVLAAYLFGSMAGGRVRAASDVDIAVVGCPAQSVYRLASQLERALGLPFDLIDLDRAPADFVSEVHRTGRCIFEREPERK